MAKENTMGNCPDQALVQRAKNGDTDALAQLITRFLPFTDGILPKRSSFQKAPAS